MERLQLPYIQSQGYVSLRCVWTLGCPAEIHPLTEALAPPPASDPTARGARAGSFYKDVFEELFPDEAVPEVVGAPCCAQFAVTAERIRMRPKSDYERYRDWLEKTPLRDDLSGRILEYSWHSMCAHLRIELKIQTDISNSHFRQGASLLPECEAVLLRSIRSL